MWDFLPAAVLLGQPEDVSLELITETTAPYGLAPRKWREQLAEIRELPEQP